MKRSSWIWSILIVALLVRLAAVPVGMRQAGSRGLKVFDEYGGIAKNIVEGRGFSYGWYGETRPTSIHAPAYPFILAGLFLLFGQGTWGVLAAVCNSIILSILLLYLVFRSAERLLGTLCGFAAFIILAFYPSQVYYAASPLPTILYEGMLFVVLVLAWRLKENISVKRALQWGLSIGLCALSYSFVLVLAPLLAFWIVIGTGRARIRRAMLHISLAALAAIVICVPWTIRNYSVHGRWIPVRDQMGTNLWWGNGPLATGDAVSSIGNSVDGFPEEIAAALRSISNEVDQDRYLERLAIDHMKKNPARTLRLWMLKARNFWWIHGGAVAAGSGMNRFMPVIKILRALLIAVSAAGFILLVRRNPSIAAVGLVTCLAITAVFTVSLSGKLRYSAPLEPILAIAAGYAIAAAAGRYLQQRARSAGR